MHTVKSKLLAGLLLGCAAFGAHACDIKEMKVVEVMTDDVGVYDANGTWVADVKKSEVPLNQNILQCKDSPAMVQIALTPDARGNKRTAWVNLLEVKVASATAMARKCKDTPVSRVTDTVMPATSGIGACGDGKK